MNTKKTEIKNFISKIIDKDYKKAHASLDKIVEDKLKLRIQKATNK